MNTYTKLFLFLLLCMNGIKAMEGRCKPRVKRQKQPEPLQQRMPADIHGIIINYVIDDRKTHYNNATKVASMLCADAFNDEGTLTRAINTLRVRTHCSRAKIVQLLGLESARNWYDAWIQKQFPEVDSSAAKKQFSHLSSGQMHHALVNAAIAHDKNTMLSLLVAGADSDAFNYFNKTALVQCIDHPELVAILLKAGANPNNWEFTFGTYPQQYPLAVAIIKHANVTVQLLLDAGADPQNGSGLCLCRAAYSKNYQALRMIFQAVPTIDPDFNTGEWYGLTPLMYAASRNFIDGVTFLIEKGADVYKKNYYGKTALDIARKNGHQEVVALLEVAMKKSEL